MHDPLDVPAPADGALHLAPAVPEHRQGEAAPHPGVHEDAVHEGEAPGREVPGHQRAQRPEAVVVAEAAEDLAAVEVDTQAAAAVVDHPALRLHVRDQLELVLLAQPEGVQRGRLRVGLGAGGRHGGSGAGRGARDQPSVGGSGGSRPPRPAGPIGPWRPGIRPGGERVPPIASPPAGPTARCVAPGSVGRIDVLVTNLVMQRDAPLFAEELEAAGVRLVFQPVEQALTEAELLTLFAERSFDAWIAGDDEVTDAVLAAATPRLCGGSPSGAWGSTVSTSLPRRGGAWRSATRPGAFGDAVAEVAVGYLLMLSPPPAHRRSGRPRRRLAQARGPRACVGDGGGNRGAGRDRAGHGGPPCALRLPRSSGADPRRREHRRRGSRLVPISTNCSRRRTTSCSAARWSRATRQG